MHRRRAQYVGSLYPLVIMADYDLLLKVVVCLLVLFMSRRDERRVKALHADESETESTSDPLDDPSDSKSKIDLVRVTSVL